MVRQRNEQSREDAEVIAARRTFEHGARPDTSQTVEYGARPDTGQTSLERALTVAAMGCWIIVLTCGMVIHSDGLRLGMVAPDGVWTALGCWTGFIMSSPATNVGVLACLAGLMGGLASRSMFLAGELPIADGDHASHRPGMRGPQKELVLSSLQGFVAYIAIISGIVALTGQQLWTTSIDQYTRLAGMVSLIAIFAGADPLLLTSIWKRVTEFIGRSPRRDQETRTPTLNRTGQPRRRPAAPRASR